MVEIVRDMGGKKWNIDTQIDIARIARRHQKTAKFVGELNRQCFDILPGKSSNETSLQTKIRKGERF